MSNDISRQVILVAILYEIYMLYSNLCSFLLSRYSPTILDIANNIDKAKAKVIYRYDFVIASNAIKTTDINRYAIFTHILHILYFSIELCFVFMYGHGASPCFLILIIVGAT